MSSKPSHRTAPARPYDVSPQARSFLRGSWRRRLLNSAAEHSRPWRERFHTQRRSLIRGLLITHRRMFGVSHKHVQANEKVNNQQADQ